MLLTVVATTVTPLRAATPALVGPTVRTVQSAGAADPVGPVRREMTLPTTNTSAAPGLRETAASRAPGEAIAPEIAAVGTDTLVPGKPENEPLTTAVWTAPSAPAQNRL